MKCLGLVDEHGVGHDGAGASHVQLSKAKAFEKPHPCLVQYGQHAIVAEMSGVIYVVHSNAQFRGKGELIRQNQFGSHDVPSLKLWPGNINDFDDNRKSGSQVRFNHGFSGTNLAQPLVATKNNLRNPKPEIRNKIQKIKFKT